MEHQPDKKTEFVRSDKCGEYYGKCDETGQLMGPLARYLQEYDIVAH